MTDHTMGLERTAIGSDMLRATCAPCNWAGFYRLSALTAKYDYAAHIDGVELKPAGEL